jgi:cell division protein FtsB
MNFHTKKIVYSLVLSASLLSSSLNATTNEQLVNSIIKLRGDVENLYTNIKENKESYHAEMKSLSMQITDSEAQINRKNTAIKLAKNELEKIKAQIKEASSGNSEIKPLVINALALLETSIKEGIPFMVEARIADLHKIKNDLEAGLITNEKALSLAWASYDDTIRVTKEIGLFKQQIDFKGEKVLARIAKLGSVAMFFSTPSNEVGFVVKDGNTYKYKHITNPDDIKKIVTLFDALQKQIRTGYFELPNALVLQGAK